jgi:hypothetical protein
MKPPTNPLPVYTPTPVQNSPYGALSAPQSLQQPPTYVIVQQAPTETSWLAQNAGKLIAGAGAGGLVVAVLLAVAVVAIAIGVGAISCAIGYCVIKTLMGSQTKK